MIGADDITTAGFWFFDQRGTAVNADIMKCPDDAVSVFGQKQRLSRHLHRVDSPGFGKLMGEFGKHPVFLEHPLAFFLKKFGIDIGGIG